MAVVVIEHVWPSLSFVFEVLHLLEAFGCLSFGFVRSTKVLPLLGVDFVAALHFANDL